MFFIIQLDIHFNLPATSNVTASDSTYCDKVRVIWDAVPNATRYYVYRGSTLLTPNGVTGVVYDDYGASTSSQTYKVHAAAFNINSAHSANYGSDDGYKKSTPGQAIVTGSVPSCQGSMAVYSASASGATSYSWTVPSGWTINSGQGTSSIVVIVGSSAGDVTAAPANACGNGTAGNLYVTVTEFPGAASVSAYFYRKRGRYHGSDGDPGIRRYDHSDDDDVCGAGAAGDLEGKCRETRDEGRRTKDEGRGTRDEG